MKKSICVIGIGYVGLPTAAMFATHGHQVVGYDVNEKAIDALNKGETIIEEPFLGDMVKQAVAEGHLVGSTECPVGSDVYIISVPTRISYKNNNSVSQTGSNSSSGVYISTKNCYRSYAAYT